MKRIVILALAIGLSVTVAAARPKLAPVKVQPSTAQFAALDFLITCVWVAEGGRSYNDANRQPLVRTGAKTTGSVHNHILWTASRAENSQK